MKLIRLTRARIRTTKIDPDGRVFVNSEDISTFEARSQSWNGVDLGDVTDITMKGGEKFSVIETPEVIVQAIDPQFGDWLKDTEILDELNLDE